MHLIAQVNEIKHPVVKFETNGKLKFKIFVAKFLPRKFSSQKSWFQNQ